MLPSKDLLIDGIPATLWGEHAGRGFVAVHGSQSHKRDVPIEILAQHALPRGWQVLSFDLPGHGERREALPPWKVQHGVADLRAVLDWAAGRWRQVGLFANSIGAYLSLMACGGQTLERALFLSPLVDMGRMIQNMMGWFHVTPGRLEAERAIPTPMGETLYFDTYRYVKEHPVARWEAPTYILYGSEDTLCERAAVQGFAQRFQCQLEIVQGAEHYFHTPGQLGALHEWLDKAL